MSKKQTSKEIPSIFKGIELRKVWFNDEWFFSVVDIIRILTESSNSRNYWKVLKHREPQLVTICNQLKLPANDGKLYSTDCLIFKILFV
jgi:hypothetical protein